MLSLCKEDILARIAKRAEMRKEISGTLAHVRTVEPEQSWNEYRTVSRARCRTKTASLSRNVLEAVLVKGAQLLDDGQERPGFIDRLKTRLTLAIAKWRLRHGGYDVLVQTGRNRVGMPKWSITESAIPELGFKPSLVAVPERGQTSLVTYRSPEGNYHLHQHKRHWFMHKDRYPSVNMAIDKIRSGKRRTLANDSAELGKGILHATAEGVPGMYAYLVNLLTGAPTFDDIAGGKAPQPILPAEIEKKAVVLEVARTPSERTRGLGGRRTLPDDYGMLFTKAGAFWMKGVPFDLDLLFVDKKGEIVDITTMKALRKGEYPEIYTSKSGAAEMAVELPGGWCRRNGIRAGHRLTLGGPHGRGQD